MGSDGEYEIPESGAVFTFGRSRFAENVSSHFFVRNDPVLEISCGDEHTALVCRSGRIFLFGNNDYGQLGFGHTKVVNKPSCLKYLKPFHSTHVACGKGHTIISTACGRVFAFGYNADGQLGLGDLSDRLVPQLIATDIGEDSIVAVSAGCHHSAFLTEKGDLYLWGSNSDGQCGVSESMQVKIPTKVEFEHPISSVSCGYYHTGFISLKQVYTFGEEDNGKLGRTKEVPKHEPGKVNIEDDCISVQCGGNHTMVLAESGRVFAFGSNFSGQLGVGSFESESTVPVVVRVPEILSENDKIISVSCGESHSGFVTSTGGLYTCGDARHGKLCNEDESKNLLTPTEVEMFKNYFCTFVSCGGCHTMVLAKVQPSENGLELPNPQLAQILPPIKLSSRQDNQSTQQSKETVEVVNGLKESEKKTPELIENAQVHEECDSKSNTESNLNDEMTPRDDEIYTEIEEMKSFNGDAIVAVDSNSGTQDKETKDNENDVVIVTKESTIKKFFSIFKKKKSATAILLKQNTDEKRNVNPRQEVNLKVGGRQTSKTCTIL